MKLYSYVVARDYGFAPNPFYGWCTLATCKPKIRQTAQVGDWVVGTGSAKYERAGKLVYAMQVTESLSFEDYWNDERFTLKRPFMSGSLKQAYGDNIYHRTRSGRAWIQENSHHSFVTGRPNPANITNDTQADRVLIGSDYVYWGGAGPDVPEKFRGTPAANICAHRGHKCKFPAPLVAEFVAWLKTIGLHGYMAEPLEWMR